MKASSLDIETHLAPNNQLHELITTRTHATYNGNGILHHLEQMQYDNDMGDKLAYSLAEEHAFGRGVKVSMSLLEQLLGSFHLPMKVTVDVRSESGAASRQVVWLKEKSSTVGVLYIHEPLLSTIRSFSHEARHWNLSNSESNGTPCLLLELGEREKAGSRGLSLGGSLSGDGKWQMAQTSANGTRYSLGHNSTDGEAARVYNSAVLAIDMKGAEATLNFPEEHPRPINVLNKALMPSIDFLKTGLVEEEKANVREEDEEEDDRFHEEEEEEEEGEEEEQGEEEVQAPNCKGRHIQIAMSLIQQLLGDTIKLPAQVMVIVPKQKMEQLVWLRGKGVKQAYFVVNEPLLSKIKSYGNRSRKWSKSESRSSDGIPCLTLDLGIRVSNGAKSAHKEEEEVEVRALTGKGNRVDVAMTMVRELLGESIQLPVQVEVDVPGEGLRQLAWLRGKGVKQATFYFEEPLLSKLKSFPHHRYWSLGESSGSDGAPCLTLVLGVKRDGAVCKYMGVHRTQGKWKAQIASNRKKISLGLYSNEEEAARIYDSAVRYLKGAQAIFNFPDEVFLPLSDEFKSKIDSAVEGGRKRVRDVEEEEDGSESGEESL